MGQMGDYSDPEKYSQNADTWDTRNLSLVQASVPFAIFSFAFLCFPI